MLERLEVVGTSTLPSIILDADLGKFEILGKSIPENAYALFSPVLDWLSDYIVIPNQITQFHFKLEYFNTSTSKYILEIARRLETLHKQGKEVQVSWYFEIGDCDVEDAGQDYASILTLPFEIIEVDAEGNYRKIKDLDIAGSESTSNINTSSNDFDVVSGISDKLQKKLNHANEKLQHQAERIRQINDSLEQRNQELQLTIRALTEAKASRKATTIVLIIALVLFVVSEGIEYLVEKYTQSILPLYAIILIKLLIALLIKPIETLLETFFLRKTHNQGLPSVDKQNII